MLALNLLAGSGVQAATMTPPFTRPQLRQKFKLAKDNAAITQEMADELGLYLKDHASDAEPIVIAYYGAVKALQAKFGGSLFNRISWLKTSMVKMDAAVTLAPEDLEVHFIRFATLQHLPNILGIRQKRGQDVSQILRLMAEKKTAEIDAATIDDMTDFLLASDRLSADQKKQLLVIQKERPRP